MEAARNQARIEVREKIAAMMLRCSLSTGHGDTVDELLAELEPQIMAIQRKALEQTIATLGMPCRTSAR